MMALFRMAALEVHFSTEYEDLVRKLAEQIITIQAAAKTATNLSLPSAAEFYDDLSSEYEGAAAVLRGECDSIKRVLETLLSVLEDKKTRVFERVLLNVVVPALDGTAVDHLNEVILKHNQACDDFQSRVDTARRQLEADSVAAELDQYVKLKGDVEAAEAAVEKADGDCKRLNEDIGKLERDIVEHREPADQLNEDLRSYLGYGELRLEVKDSDKDPGYLIMRHGMPAETLSEGETTAIALLYFLKSLGDRRFNLPNGVVVLDDPVSSLDANSLYSAFGLIQERTKQAAQVFILTHDFTFFRQVRNWFHYLNRKKPRPARFYMLECVREGDRRCAGLRALDPLLEQFESEYHYLFATVYRAATAAPQPQLERNYVLPNLARRLLEAFLAFRQPQTTGDLRKKMELVKCDEATRIRVVRFLHTYSHNDALGEPAHDLSLLGEAQSILKDLLKVMQSEDPGHFSAMVSAVTASATGDQPESGTTPAATC